jgi:hypothetical protein
MDVKKLNLLLLSFIFVFVCACSSPPTGSTAGIHEVRIAVTRDFGSEVLLEKKLALSSPASALDALKQVARVETAYGGGFVRGINGLESEFKGPASSRKDWFIYINGMLANTGALDYTLQAGDTEQWDYHTWSFQQTVPAITGSFPQPFSGGYAGKTRPVYIVYAEGFSDQAEAIEKALTGSGAAGATLIEAGELAEKEKQEGNLIIIAAPGRGLVEEMNRNWKRLGFFARLENGQISTLTAAGQASQVYGAGTGWIQATQNPWNPDGIGADENVAWLVTGTDTSGIKAAAACLAGNSTALRNSYSVIIVRSGDRDQVIRLPRQ